jgi:hypothetical protein
VQPLPYQLVRFKGVDTKVDAKPPVKRKLVTPPAPKESKKTKKETKSTENLNSTKSELRDIFRPSKTTNEAPKAEAKSSKPGSQNYKKVVPKTTNKSEIILIISDRKTIIFF